MKSEIKKELKNFIDDINNREIKANEIVVGILSDEIVNYLYKSGIDLQSADITLEVGRYFHILNKVKKDTQIEEDLFYDLDFYIENASIVIYIEECDLINNNYEVILKRQGE